MYRNRKVGVSVPAYNEEDFILDTLSGIPDFVDRIYVCNDASRDGTKNKVEEFIKQDGRVVLIDHAGNQGVGGAIVDCHKKAIEEGMEIIAVMAGDNQMDPGYLHLLLDPLIEGRADYAKGNRLYERDSLKGMSRWRFTGNAILTLLTKVATGNWNVSDPQNGYTAITAEALRRLPLDSMYKGYLFENDMLVKLNSNYMRIQDVPIPARYGDEVSDINYYSFITKGMLFMVRSFLWRVKSKYIVRNLRHVRVASASGLAMMLLGMIILIATALIESLDGYVWLMDLIAPLMLFALGTTLFVSTAMYRKNHYGAEREGHEGG